MMNHKKNSSSIAFGICLLKPSSLKLSSTLLSGSKEETPQVRAAKREMSDALKERRTELEDRLYDKVQELKRLCLQEAVSVVV